MPPKFQGLQIAMYATVPDSPHLGWESGSETSYMGSTYVPTWHSDSMLASRV